MRILAFAALFSTAVMATFGGDVAQSQTLQGGISGGQTSADFNTNDGAGSGAALPGRTNVGDTSLFAGNGGGVMISHRPNPQGNSLGISFSALMTGPQTGVGFDREYWPQQSLHAELFSGVNDLGGMDFQTASLAPAGLVGFQEFTAFDQKVFANTADHSEFFGLDKSEPENVNWDVFEVSDLLSLLGLAGIGLAIAAYRRCKAN